MAIRVLPVALLIPFFTNSSHIQVKQQAEARPVAPILIFLGTIVFFAFAGAELGFGGWIYTFNPSQRYGDPAMLAGINTAFWAALTIGRLIAIPISVKLKSQKILWMNFCGIIISLLILIFFSSAEIFLWLGTIGTSFFMASIFPTLLNDAQSRMHLSGKITSIFFAGSSLGGMALPWLMGPLITPYGATTAMLVVLGSILLASGMFYILNIKRGSVALPRANY